MNNDLISRDYVADKICDLYSDGEKATKKDRIINEVLDIIDNAPAVSLVEPVCEIKVNITEEEKQKLIEELQKPHKPLILPEPEIAFERPQGEWITHQTGPMLWEECDQCHAQVGTVGMNFCPNCGADMRKGGAE